MECKLCEEEWNSEECVKIKIGEMSPTSEEYAYVCLLCMDEFYIAYWKNAPEGRKNAQCKVCEYEDDCNDIQFTYLGIGNWICSLCANELKTKF